jgi:Acetyltransferase (GNAT) domain
MFELTELEAEDSRWEDFVTSVEAATVYHHPGWLRALESEYGQRAVRLACIDAGRVVGILPLMCTRGLPFHREGAVSGRRLSSLPRTPIAGPVWLSAGAKAALVREAMRRAETSDGTRLELKVRSPVLDDVADVLVGRPWRNTYVLELPPAPGDVRFGTSRNHAAIKRAVTRARSAGVAVRDGGSLEDVRAWYRLYLLTMRANVVPARSFRFFASLWQNLQPPGIARLLLAEVDQRQPLAGLLLLDFGDTVSYAFGGSDPAGHVLRPNDMLHWHAIHDACERGYRFYDLGEVDEANTGLAAYKRKWVQSPRMLYRYYLPSPQVFEGFTRGGLRSRALQRIWIHLPLPATRVAGDVFYRFL